MFSVILHRYLSKKEVIIMKTERITLKKGNKRISINAKVACSIWKGIGLMFSRREKARILVFKFRKPTRMAIHSLFVFFPFIAVWTGSDGKVMEIRRVNPFSGYVCPSKPFISLVEIPLSRKYKKIIQNIVGKGKI